MVLGLAEVYWFMGFTARVSVTLMYSIFFWLKMKVKVKILSGSLWTTKVSLKLARRAPRRGSILICLKVVL